MQTKSVYPKSNDYCTLTLDEESYRLSLGLGLLPNALLACDLSTAVASAGLAVPLL
jgi:hypothetical protein